MRLDIVSSNLSGLAWTTQQVVMTSNGSRGARVHAPTSPRWSTACRRRPGVIDWRVVTTPAERPTAAPTTQAAFARALGQTRTW
jgi:hypothetical protein